MFSVMLQLIQPGFLFLSVAGLLILRINQRLLYRMIVTTA